MTNKLAHTDHPINSLLSSRWSPYGFSQRAVPPEELRSLFEAARWAASSNNEQPWRYLVASRDQAEEFEKVLSCLVEANQVWARHASALALGVFKRTFSHNGQPNLAAPHDLGAASATLTVEATARGLAVHQMRGILPDRARELFGVPEDFEVLTGLAIGYQAAPEALPENLQARDEAERKRRPLSEFLYSGSWGTPSSLAH